MKSTLYIHKFLKKLNYVLSFILKKPKYFVTFVFGRFVFFREILFYLYHREKKPSNNNTVSFFNELDIEKAVDSLRTDGFYNGLTLPDAMLEEIIDFTRTNKCYAGGDPNLGFYLAEKQELELIFEKPLYMADYFNVTEFCPVIKKLIHDPKLTDVIDTYIGTQSTYTGCSLTWIFPVKTTPYDTHRMESCNFHFDIDDYTSLRIFFYLTDVTPETGPHVCVAGSHRKKSLNHVFNFLSRKQTDTKIVDYYSAEKVIQICGKAGFGFFEDTFCFHKGTVPKTHPRLMLMLHFAINNYNNGQYSDSRSSTLLKSYKRTP